MPLQEIRNLRKWKASRRIVIHVERKSSLHGKRVSNNNLMIMKLIVIYILLKSNSNNGEQQIRG